QADRLFAVEIGLGCIVQLAEGRAGAVEHRFPAGRVYPALQVGAINALALVVVELVGNALLVQPGAGLLHRVAVLDAVDRYAHSHASSRSQKRISSGISI